MRPVTSAVWYHFQGPGVDVCGPVQGSGGTIASSSPELAQERMRAMIDQARDERPIGCYEPRPGCVAVYPDYSYLGHGKAVTVDLRQDGLTFSVKAGPWESEP